MCLLRPACCVLCSSGRPCAFSSWLFTNQQSRWGWLPVVPKVGHDTNQATHDKQHIRSPPFLIPFAEKCPGSIHLRANLGTASSLLALIPRNHPECVRVFCFDTSAQRHVPMPPIRAVLRSNPAPISPAAVAAAVAAAGLARRSGTGNQKHRSPANEVGRYLVRLLWQRGNAANSVAYQRGWAWW